MSMKIQNVTVVSSAKGKKVMREQHTDTPNLSNPVYLGDKECPSRPISLYFMCGYASGQTIYLVRHLGNEACALGKGSNPLPAPQAKEVLSQCLNS